MKNLNIYIVEAWSGVKQQSIKSEIEAWCEDMDIQNYTVNSKGEIDVDGDVCLMYRKFKELPYKFGTVIGDFNIKFSNTLISLKNCPNFVGKVFSCSYNQKLDSLDGCPKEVGKDFFCRFCKRNFMEKEVKSLCKVKGVIRI